MSKFNLSKHLTKQAEKDDKNYTTRLAPEHVVATNEVTEEQLKKDRVPEKNVTMEKLLEVKRNGGSDQITERNLNTSKSKLVKHRNAEAYTGDFNKLEEQRVAKKKMEDETSKPASETPEDMRWWKQLKADAEKNIKTAQGYDWNNDSFGRTYDDPPETSMGDSSDELYPNHPKMPNDQDMTIEEIGLDPLRVDVIKPIPDPLSGLYVSFDVNNSANLGEAELKELAYNKLLSEGYGYLSDIPDFTVESFKVSRSGDQVKATLIGDEYIPTNSAETNDESDAFGTPFTVADVQETDVAGIVLGSIEIDPENLGMVLDMDKSTVADMVTKEITNKYPNIMVEPDGFDFADMESGKFNFVGQTEMTTMGNDDMDAFAMTDFDIVVMAKDTKKK